MRKIFLIISILSIAAFLHSCSRVSIADNKRILVEGRLINEEGDPLENVNIRILTPVSRFLNNGYEMVSQAQTNANGEISFISLDVDPGILCLDIQGTGDYQSLFICDSSFSRATDENLFSLGEFKLKRRKQVYIIAELEENLPYEITYEKAYAEVKIENWNELSTVDDEYFEGKFQVNTGIFNAENGRDTLNIFSVMNTNITLLLRYPNREETIEIPVNSETRYYEINL